MAGPVLARRSIKGPTGVPGRPQRMAQRLPKPIRESPDSDFFQPLPAGHLDEYPLLLS